MSYASGDRGVPVSGAGRPVESAWQKGLREANKRPSAPAPTAAAPEPLGGAPGPTIGPGLELAGDPMDPMQSEVAPPLFPQAMSGLRAAIGQTGGEQFGAQAAPAPVQEGLGRRLYPQGGMALAQRVPKVY